MQKCSIFYLNSFAFQKVLIPPANGEPIFPDFSTKSIPNIAVLYLSFPYISYVMFISIVVVRDHPTEPIQKGNLIRDAAISALSISVITVLKVVFDIIVGFSRNAVVVSGEEPEISVSI